MSVAAEYRADRAVSYALRNAENNLFGGELLALEELVEQLLACFGNRFLDSLAQTFESVAHIGKSGGRYVALGVVLVSLVIKEVDVGVSLAVLNVGNNNGADRGTEGRLECFKYAIETRVLVAQTIDKEHLCQTCLCSRLNSLFGADADAVLARYNDQSGVRSAHTLGNAARKVKETGCVDEVDFGVLPLYRSHGCHDRRLTLNFLAVEIEHGVAVCNLAQSVADLCEIENGLRNRGLTAAAVSRERDV